MVRSVSMLVLVGGSWVCPPFTDSTPDQARVACLVVVWVWLGGTLLLLGSEHVRSEWRVAWHTVGS